jgi:hypothetical protein
MRLGVRRRGGILSRCWEGDGLVIVLAGGQAAPEAAEPRVQAVPVSWEISPFWVSEGGLEPRSGWYITETVIYHQSKLTRQRPPGPASCRRIAAPPPGRMTSPST